MGDQYSLQVLASKSEIQDTLYRFVRGADRVDEGLMLSCFHTDALIDHGDYNGGREQYTKNVARNSSQGLLYTSHNIVNMIIDVDCDEASSEAVMDGHIISESPDGLVHGHISSRYLDRWRKEGGAWKIFRHLIVNDWWDTRIIQQNPAVGQWLAAMPKGRRDRQDLSYEYIQL